MCRYCVEYGNGTKWYLNPDNYNPELYKSEFHSKSFNMLTGVGKNTFEMGALRVYDDFVPDYYGADPGVVGSESLIRHQGQVVPTEDILKVIDLAGDRFALAHCACRRYNGDDDFYSCLWFEVAVDRILEQRTWETDTKVLTKAEAKQFIREMSALGMVHTLLDVGTDTDGKPPVVVCNCQITDCVALRLNALFGSQPFGGLKSEYVAQIHVDKCAKKCQDCQACLKRCTFGALAYNPLKEKVEVMISKCYGCGACRSVCSNRAIKLVDRKTYPSLVDNW